MRNISFAITLFTLASCSGSVGRYTDTRAQDSIQEAKTRDLAPRTLKGAELDSFQRWFDSAMVALREKTGLDSASFYDIPQGHVRVTQPDGTTYIRKLTPEELEEQRKDFERVNGKPASGPITAYDLDGNRVGTAGHREAGKPYKIDTSGLPPGTYMLSIPGEKQMKKIVVQ